MTRFLVLLAATAVAGLSLTTAASADKPIREPVVIDDIELVGFCSFPVLAEITANNQHVTIFSDGRILFTGKLFVQLTNLDTDESLDLNISGPGILTPTSERGFGRGLYLAFPEDARGPGLFLLTGRVDFIRAETGFIENLTVRGRFVDVCAQLAPS